MDKDSGDDMVITMGMFIATVVVFVILIYIAIYINMTNETKHEARTVVQPSRSIGDAEETAPSLVTYKRSVPKEAFLVNEDFARSVVSNCYIRHDGRLYSIARISKEVGEKYDIGTGSQVRYLYDFGASGYAVAMGDFDVLTVGSGDELVERTGESLVLHPVELVGYAIPVVEHSHSVPRVTMKLPDGDATWLDIEEAKMLRIVNTASERVHQWYDLRYGEAYDVTWQKNGVAEQATMYAVCECYKADFADKHKINLSRYKHKGPDGANVYDFSGIPNGKYLVVGLASYGIIDIEL